MTGWYTVDYSTEVSEVLSGGDATWNSTVLLPTACICDSAHQADRPGKHTDTGGHASF